MAAEDKHHRNEEEKQWSCNEVYYSLSTGGEAGVENIYIYVPPDGKGKGPKQYKIDTVCEIVQFKRPCGGRGKNVAHDNLVSSGSDDEDDCPTHQLGHPFVNLIDDRKTGLQGMHCSLSITGGSGQRQEPVKRAGLDRPIPLGGRSKGHLSLDFLKPAADVSLGGQEQCPHAGIFLLCHNRRVLSIEQA